MPQTDQNRSLVRLRNLYVDRIGMPDLLERVNGFIHEDEPHQIVTVNLRFMSIAQRNQSFAKIVNNSHVAVADGTPLLWLSRLMRTPIAQRITGCDLLYNFSSLASEKGYSIFLLGAAPGVAEEAASRLCARYPGLNIAGTHHGYYSEETEPEVLEYIKRCQPHFLFVALGCPKQDFWIHDHMHELGVPVCVGVGGSLEIITDRLKRAPAWIQRWGLEWAYRIKQEPRRLWRRYVLEDIPTAFRVAGWALQENLFNKGRS